MSVKPPNRANCGSQKELVNSETTTVFDRHYAWDLTETLTEEDTFTAIEQNLVKFPIELSPGKVVIYATIFKCGDPVLTIATCLYYKGERFLFPQTRSERTIAERKREHTGALRNSHCINNHF
ncbi:hypothetical protein ILUMI_22264 [Ignelater luminosus]|uniref:Uncharacterized protein n=1 Tax=Ignelater luminosus TaxID=2038154 RepID=A0A8K0CD15_IGNLU|nr:hypothetical protein ILUMI_22264 [Ignelater luminosus]